MIYLLLARVRVDGRHNQVGVIGELECPVFLVNRMQVGRSDGVRRWPYSADP